MHTGFMDNFFNGFMFGMFASRPSFGCYSAYNSPYLYSEIYNYSQPAIPSINKELLNSVFEVSIQEPKPLEQCSFSNIHLYDYPQPARLQALPLPTFSSVPDIYTPYLNGDIYTCFPSSCSLNFPSYPTQNYSFQRELLSILTPDLKRDSTKAKTTVSENPVQKSKAQSAPVQKVPTQRTSLLSRITQPKSQVQKVNNNEQYFDLMLKCVLEREGGYVNDPDDPGGETNKGITKATYDRYRKSKHLPIRSVKYITDAEIKDIYYNNYYKYYKIDKIQNPQLALYTFDAYVNMSPERVKRIINKSNGDITKFEKYRRQEYENIIKEHPKRSKYRNGWNNRVTSVKQFAKNNLPDNSTAVA